MRRSMGDTAVSFKFGGDIETTLSVLEADVSSLETDVD